ncbi:4-hydroxythreonine-4-phosphate dehydrogenase [Campylobacter hyointestinalis]|uniref:4-hydroxythreonine-4-phosphate dehydrogenase n=1 Tax=Campylobacter hyointestinalis TaxID=198 RepID=UPI0004D38574|nr:4-hydroxythreonine-4-phosphate dehydrogenase [Campylobacter hyointestinalis]ANE32516.1 4-hydroxy-L-threonine phosphate dehydrogenase, NAD-dependent [Campylobacter hyointestinalis subsp. hyointestinalis LMG 9260]KEA45138.1 4-hydroxythreonine-4-phosphate dehydrogenase [Campylobacter hyointestinalis subsp. hyointestinalis]QKF55682.1 4-hydroxy-L-threonine phosphate dehydrogenase, NAD-dependent [Campylobacter hyointestinalis subsp. hyointestinalis]TXK48485.1 4-hydroxythreonine-4-phosphate dehydro
MSELPKIAISVGDINGVGIEIALKSHEEISKICSPVYFINKYLLENAANLLKLKIPSDLKIVECGKSFKIKPGKVSKKSGKFSFISFENALLYVKNAHAKALVTLPINKESWKKASLPYVGHTDVLSKHFKKNAIMMLGCDELFVALFTDHIPLSDVSKKIVTKDLTKFLLNLYSSTKFDNVGVLGFNPHASDNGTIGKKEEVAIKKAIQKANLTLKKDIFKGPLVPDAAFNKNSLKSCNRLVAMYHDGGLAPLKALFFDRSINVSLGLPIVRTSVDHGTAFDIAYKGIADNKSYLEAVKFAIKLQNCS